MVKETAPTSATSALASQRWRRLIPLAFITYSFAYLDRSNYSLGAAGGLKHALHISSAPGGAARRPVLHRLLRVPGPRGAFSLSAAASSG